MMSAALRWTMALALFALVGTTLAFRDHFDATTLSAWVEDAGAASPIVFIAVYAAAQPAAGGTSGSSDGTG